MKSVYIILIAIWIVYFENHRQNMTLNDYIIMYAIVLFVGALIYKYERTPKNINDLKKYRSIDDVIKKYGVPDDIEQFDEYTTYTFKKSTNGWGHNKYKVDVFIVYNNQLVKHSSFYE